MSTSPFTPGPWRWELSLKSKEARLCGGRPLYDLTVMDFTRWGMGGAAPRFRVGEMDVMHRAETFAATVPGREHHSAWFQTLLHPDALLIAASPDMASALLGLESRHEPGVFCDHAAAPCDRCDAAIAALRKAGLR